MIDTYELRSLLDDNRTSPLPWEWVYGPTGRQLTSHGYSVGLVTGYTDTRLIVAAVNALPTLLGELDRLRAEVAQLQVDRDAAMFMYDERDRECTEAALEIAALKTTLARVEQLPDPLGDALNSGDGVYRP